MCQLSIAKALEKFSVKPRSDDISLLVLELRSNSPGQEFEEDAEEIA